MSTYKIAVFVGSLRAASINLRLARALEKLVPADFKFEYVSLGDVPLYNQDNENNLPAPAAKLKQQIADAQGILFVSPEHNRSVPAAIKNAIDWGSRPWGQNSWTGKTVGVVGASPSAAGTAMMQQHLRNILAAEGANTLTTPEVFLQYTEGLVDDQFNITNEGTRKFLQGWIDRYVDWVKKLNA
ncbi:NAD(P)H-dependent oxidoreductase [Achromobacter spanius]|uniref:NADPH-dependent FMN reductase n=1 Tax=Achromobacter spanius TaxID=217203 RepID=UPI003207D6DB